MRLSYGGAPVTLFDVLEIILTLCCVVVAFTRPTAGRRWFARIEAYLVAVTRRPALCILILGLFVVVFRLLIFPVYGAPAPYIHDEYAYLLQADTFASGRLTNAPPPLPQHFESVYILVRPTYAAEYQPAQALVLALGQKLTGVAWLGVVASMAVLCIALYWALLAWLPPAWALVGTGIFEVSIGVLSYWMNSYWGGCVPALGGALALGALPRLRDGFRSRYAAMMAAGLVIVLNSRPLEGTLLLAIAAGALLHWRLITQELSSSVLLRHVIPPMVAILAAALLSMGWYNYRVTGSAKTFPYLLYRQRYGMPQGFFWQKPVVTTTPMPIDIRAEYAKQLEQHARARSAVSLVLATSAKIRSLWEFYIGIPLTIPLFFLPFIWRGRNMGLVLCALIIVVIVDNLTFFAYFPHYSAPVTVLIMLTIMQCIRRLRLCGEPGLFLSRSLPLVCVLGLLIPSCGRLLERALPASMTGLATLWTSEFLHYVSREKFVSQLENEPGQQLVFVRYDPAAHTNNDYAWVYNAADITHAKIVWARELDPESNRQLLKIFAGRKLWLGEPDAMPQRVIPYEPSSLNTKSTGLSSVPSDRSPGR